MPTNRRHRLARRRHTGKLTGTAEMFLKAGCHFFPDAEVLDDTEYRRLWEEHRDEIIARYSVKHPGCRPWAFWVYDKSRERPFDREDEGPILRAMRLLSNDELAAVERQQARRAEIDQLRAMI